MWHGRLHMPLARPRLSEPPGPCGVATHACRSTGPTRHDRLNALGHCRWDYVLLTLAAPPPRNATAPLPLPSASARSRTALSFGFGRTGLTHVSAEYFVPGSTHPTMSFIQTLARVRSPFTLTQQSWIPEPNTHEISLTPHPIPAYKPSPPPFQQCTAT